MTLMILGLVIFLGAHSVRIFAEPWRAAQVARLGPGAWKGLYSVVSIVGFVLIVWGYGDTRTNPVDLWSPPRWMSHVTALLTLPAFILLVAAYVPRTRIQAAVGHPMVLGVKLWAFSHLLSNGRLADVVLFGAFLVWAILDFRAAKARDRAAGTRRTPGPVLRDVFAVVIGTGAWMAFALHLHAWLIGVRPFG